MLPTSSIGWNALQALKSRLSGRLARFKRNASDDGRPHKSQNDAAFFDTDLRYIFTTTYTISDFAHDEYYEMDQKALDLLASLDSMVNSSLVDAQGRPNNQGPGVPTDHHEPSPHDIAMISSKFPRLGALMGFLGTSLEQFNLAQGPGPALFILPQGDAGTLAIRRLSEWRKFVELSAMSAQDLQGSQFQAFERSETPVEEKMHTKPIMRQKTASVIIDAIFKEFRQGNCGEVHEIKLRVPDEWQGNNRQSVLDMFVSSGPSGSLWQETQCGPFQVTVGRNGICAAIQRAMAQGRKLYLFFDDEQGLLDISDKLPPKSSSSDSLMSESLSELLDQKLLTKITPRDYLQGADSAKMSCREKAALALGLARCLMDFFDGEADLASYSWKPETVYFIRSSGADAKNRKLYISLRPHTTNSRSADLLKTVGPGNPILLSFAKLLLEIESGEKIPMDIHSDNRRNIPKWGEMCAFVNVAGMEGNGDYIKAVEGCLYLHMALPKSTPDEKSSNISGELLRKAIYEQVVQKLELIVNPHNSKRKRRDSIPELPLSKKLSMSPEPETNAQTVTSSRHIYRPPIYTRPESRDEFEFAIVCALPREYDAVSLLFDEFWDEDYDYYGRADGDPNIYTTGRVGKVNVVLVLLPNMGKASAAGTSASLRSSYPRLRFVLVTGICGGVPSPAEDEEIILGDVIISRCIVQYDIGRMYSDEFVMRDTVEDNLGRAPKSVRSLLAIFETDLARDRLEKMASLNLQRIQHKAAQKTRGAKYRYPGTLQDRLFQAAYLHKHRHSFQCLCTKSESSGVSTCQVSQKLMCEDLGCDIKRLVRRKRLELKRKLEQGGHSNEAQAPSIFVGRIGSGDIVLKSGEHRDRIAKEHDIIAFEMEGAGVWDEIPCIVVKAVCDYADSHKNKLWQDFAAATAASVTKALLERYIQRENTSLGVFSRAGRTCS